MGSNIDVLLQVVDERELLLNYSLFLFNPVIIKTNSVSRLPRRVTLSPF